MPLPPPSRTDRTRGQLLILAAAILWSTGGLFIKVLTDGEGPYRMAPQALACLRSAAAGLTLAWALPGLRGVSRLRVTGSALVYGVALWAFVMATNTTTSANAIFLQYAFPLVVAVGAWTLFAERPSGRTAASLAVGMAGVAVILAGSWRPGAEAGLLYGVTSALSLAAFVLLQRAIRQGSPLALTSAYNLIGAVAMLPLAWGLFDVSAAAVLLVGVQGVVQIGLPYVLFIKGLRSVPAAEAGLICLIEPVLNPLWVWLGVGETPNRWTLLGGAVILAALAVRFSSRRAPVAAVPSPD